MYIILNITIHKLLSAESASVAGSTSRIRSSSRPVPAWRFAISMRSGCRRPRPSCRPKGPFKAVKADITNKSEAQTLFDDLVKEFGKIDVLVNNAGIMDHFDPVGEVEDEMWEHVMALNLHAPYFLSKLAARNMLEQPKPDGRIINIVSVAGRAGWAGGKSSQSMCQEV